MDSKTHSKPAGMSPETSADISKNSHSTGGLVFCGATIWDWVGRKSSTNSKTMEMSLDQGAAYTFGRNQNGQLGDGTTTSRSDPFRINIKGETFVKAAVGKAHTLLVTASGRVYAAGENKRTEHCLHGEVRKYGQLGDGKDHSYISGTSRMIYDPQMPKPITKLEDKKIVAIACGTNHSLALDDQGAVYSWGCGGYGRLGLPDSPPKDIFVPTEVPGFKDRNNMVKKIACGTTSCMAIDGRNALYLWGKWKQSGDGGQGTPWLYPKHYPGLSGWEVWEISAGGSTLFALAGESTVSWGQNAYHGELGHGPNAPRSCVNADIVKGMEGISCKKVSCGLGFTLMVADKSSKPFADLPAIGELITTSPFAEVSTPAATKKVAAGTKAKAPAAKGKRKTSDEPGKDAADALVADAELTTKPKKGKSFRFHFYHQCIETDHPIFLGVPHRT
ncbi:hypothetical protein BDEG_27408 [Batrachochytrium dendrobatidis JEL423]|uniref:RCC1-like domain-containing protein n=1 Tax=Batrachochytrium dendrobatidis (strain JEL423) TaxID=403673 RepID=A0A177WW81_BATDL|nr:hypothetical protein BDEG_27408 [Batrachochytrium dendrobatidis JEL423]